MRILIHTQYYPPEIGAPQNRLHDLAVRLQKLDIEVEVLTAMPNYPSMKIHEGYKNKFYKKESIEGIQLFRSWIFVTQSKGIFLRLLNYFSFVFSSFWIGWFKTKKYDYILCESPPLFLGITTYLLCKLKGAKLIFNVSDLWPESAEKLDLVTNQFFLKLAYKLEAFLYRKAFIITGQTKGIVRDIKTRFPETNPYWLPNGVDLDFFNSDREPDFSWRESNGYHSEDVLFLYAGIIGHAQGLEVILKAAKLIDNQKVKFVLVGDGPVKNELLELKLKMKLTNVSFYPSIPKMEIFKVIQSVDAVVVPLRKLDLFLGAIPSKIFENLAMKKALLLGVDGESRDLFVKEGNCGLYFEPENEHELANQVNLLMENRHHIEELGENGLKYVEKHFNRKVIAREFKEFLINKEL